MNKVLELPSALYDALQAAAEASGTTPQEWIAVHLGKVPNGEQLESPRILAELFKGKTGLYNTGSQDALSEKCGERFADYVNEKRHEGRL
jgi:hypothetical protein